MTFETFTQEQGQQPISERKNLTLDKILRILTIVGLVITGMVAIASAVGIWYAIIVGAKIAEVISGQYGIYLYVGSLVWVTVFYWNRTAMYYRRQNLYIMLRSKSNHGH